MNPEQPGTPPPTVPTDAPTQTPQTPTQPYQTQPTPAPTSLQVDAMIAQQSYSGFTEPISVQPVHNRKKQALMVITSLLLIAVALGGSTWAIRRSQAQTRVIDLNESTSESTAITDSAANMLADETLLSDDSTASDNASAPQENKTEGSSSNSGISSPTKPQNSATSATKKTAPVAQAISVTCTKNRQFPKPLSTSILSQAESSIEQAIAGRTITLTAWVPRRYQVATPDSDPTNVNKSFKGLKPVECTVFPTSIRKKNQYSQSGASLIVRFKDKSTQKPYITTVNVSLVSGTWKTDSVTRARTK